jgi:hypothetical protein
LVFQIRNTTGGDSTIDDGGTPTDAGDDRVLFTPADPPPPSATIAYQALDPDGALSESTVTVYINADAALPDDARSEAVPTENNASSSGKCGTGTTSTSTTTSTTQLTTESSGPPVTDAFPSVTTKKTTKSTTTTRPKSTSTTKPSTSSTTHPSTTQPPSTSTSHPTTTQTTQPDQCGPYPTDGTQEEKDAWTQCHIDQGH